MTDGVERTDFARLMALLDLGTRGKSPSAKPARAGEPSQLDVWFAELRDLPKAALEAAVHRFLCECHGSEQWPTIAILRKFSVEHLSGIPLVASAAWEAVQGVARHWSFYRSREENKALVDTLPEPARSVVTRIGWKTLSEAKDRDALRREFGFAYAEALDRFARQRALPAKICPRIDAAKEIAPGLRGTPKGLDLPPSSPLRLLQEDAGRPVGAGRSKGGGRTPTKNGRGRSKR